MNAPGVKFEFVDLNRPPVARLRTDICGFALFAERGPLDRAVKLTSWRQFLDSFGAPLAFSHGGQSIRLFFENGGAVAHVARISDAKKATSAQVTLTAEAAGIVLQTAFSGISNPKTRETGPLSMPLDGVAQNPGSWGNRLAVRVAPAGSGLAETPADQPADGGSLRVNTIAGFHVGSWVRLLQNGQAHDTFVRVASIDTQLKEITWETPVTGGTLNFALPLRLETVEFSLVLTLDGQEVARYETLSLDSEHPRYLPLVLSEEATLIAGEVTHPRAALADPRVWPSSGLPQQFSGGADGLAEVEKEQFLTALDHLAQIDEISVLAIPDLVLVPEPEFEAPEPPLAGDLCHIPEPLAEGVMRGRVVSAGDGAIVKGAQITSPDAPTRSAVTDANGVFLMTGLPLGQSMLRIEKSGFIPIEVTAQTFEFATPQPQDFELAARSLPAPLSADAIFEVQQAMLAQGERGLYRVALLDVPGNMLRIEDAQSWRSRFDSSFGALYWPWLRIVPEGETLARDLPPSGAVAGLLARMDLAEGPQRSPANRTLRAVQAITDVVDDPIHALLNEQGINVLRPRPGRGIAPQGARTLSSESEWRYLGVRRLMLMIAEAIEEGHQWAVFEPNTQILRDAITHSLNAFLNALWRRGAFAGNAPEAAFAVKCDIENNPPEVVDAGRLVAQIAVAPVRPFEFIRMRLGRTDRLRVQVQE